MLMTKELLCADIIAAFDGVSRGEGITLHQAEEMDNRSSLDEQRAARSLDTDARWQDVPHAWIEDFSFVWYFFDAAAFRYYLPALMIWNLGPGRRSMSASANNAECLLYDDSRRKQLLPLLNAQHRRAIAGWLYFIASDRPFKPEEAIARFQKSCWQPSPSDNSDSG